MTEQGKGDALHSLLSDPAALSSIAKLISNLSAQAPSASGSDTAQESNSKGNTDGADKNNGSNSGGDGVGGINGGNGGIGANATAPDLSGLMSALSNPAILNSIASMAPLLSSMMSGQGGGGGRAEQGIPGGLGGAAYPRPVHPTDRRSALLLALKPYMPEDKQSAIDTVVRVIEIMSAIR